MLGSRQRGGWGRRWLAAGPLAALLLASACLVEPGQMGQRPFAQATLEEPVTKTPFKIYLPPKYDGAQRHPLVVVLHGLNPYDTWDGQVLAWQSTADKYGLIVVVPKLETTGPTCPIPPGPDYPTLPVDTRNVIAIRDYVARTYAVDGNRVLLTSWSAGGYVANYIFSRFPHKFNALALWGSNWNEALVSLPTLVGAKNTPIWIGWGEGDFALAGIVSGSKAAGAFYRANGFTRVQEYEEPGLGHQRRPNLVAGFFLNATRLQAGAADVQILASTNIGFAPLTVSLSAKLPPDMPADSDYMWFFGQDRTIISQEPSVTKVMDKPGHYPVEVMVRARNGPQRFQASTEITVLPPPNRDELGQ